MNAEARNGRTLPAATLLELKGDHSNVETKDTGVGRAERRCGCTAAAGAVDADTGSTNDGYFYEDQDDNLSRRHNNGSEMLFFDGHVKFEMPEYVRAQGYAIGGTGPAPRGTACP